MKKTRTTKSKTTMTATLFLTAAASTMIIATPGLAVAAPVSPATIASDQPVNPSPKGDCTNPNTGTNPGGNGTGANGSNGGSTAGTNPGAGASNPALCDPGTGGATSGNSFSDQNGRSGLG